MSRSHPEAISRGGGSVLCVANYPSDETYAWWLMENYWVQIAELASQRGGRTIVAFPELKGLSQRMREANLTPLEFDVARAPTLRQLFRLARFLRAYRIRTVYFTDRPYLSALYPILRASGVRSIVIHDHTPGERPLPPAFRMAIKRLLHALRVFSGNRYVGVSRFVVRRFVEIGGIPAKRCEVVHNGIPLTGFPTYEVRRLFGLPAEASVVVSSGRVHSYKGIDFILRLAAELIINRGRDDLYFVHLGDGPDMDRYRLLAGDLKLHGRFIFAGRRSDVRSILPSCTVALHASDGEAFSLAILEFMASELPPVVPDHCGNAEAVEHGVNGFLYPPGDLPTAATLVGRLLDDPALRRSLGENGRLRIEREFSLDGANRRFRAVIEPCIRLE